MRNIGKRRTLKDSIIKSFAVSLSILFVMEILIYLGCRELYYSRLHTEMKYASNSMSYNIDKYFESVNNLSYSIFYNSIFSELAKQDDADMQSYRNKLEKINSYFSGFIASNELISGVDFYNKSGRYYFSTTESDSQINASALAEMTEMAENSDGKMLYSAEGHKNFSGSFSGLAFRQIGSSGTTFNRSNVTGLGILHLDINKIVESLFSTLDIEGFSAYVIDESGKCVYNMNGNKSTNENTVEELSDMRLKKEPAEIKINGKKYFAYSTHLENFNWNVYVIRDETDIEKNMSVIFLVLCCFLGINILILILLRRNMNNEFIKPVRELAEAMKNVAGSRMRVRLDLKCNNEIGDITTAFNDMNNDVRQLTEKIMNNQKRFYELDLEKAGYELVSLQNQINSHFLYNTLYYIRNEARVGALKNVNSAINNLCSFLRYSVEAQQYVRLKDELENIGYYINIVSVRNGGNVHYIIECEKDLEDCRVLKLIIQPLVENSLVHGYIVGGVNRITLKISCSRTKNGELQIRVIDTGVGIEKSKTDELNRAIIEDSPELSDMMNRDRHHGIGLKNINRRLKIYYGEKYILRIKSFEGIGTIIKIVIPKEEFKIK